MTSPTPSTDTPAVAPARAGAGHTWHIAATIFAVAAIGAIQVSIEHRWFDASPVEDVAVTLGPLWLTYLLCAVISTALFTTIRVMRGGQMATLRYSERYLVGLGYGIVTSLLVAVGTGVLLGSSAGQAVEYSGMAMTMSLVSLQMPIACIVGGLIWHLLTRVSGPAPARERRPWEDE